MKRYLSLPIILFLFISNFTFAQVNNNLVVFNNDGEKFILIMNGVKYNEAFLTTVKVKDLNLSKYEVRIIFENEKIKDHVTTLTFFSTGYECVFGLNSHGKRKYTMDFVSDSRIDPGVPVTNSNTTNNNTNTGTSYTNTNTTSTNTYNSTNTNTPINTNTNYSNTNYSNTNTTTNSGNNPSSISIKAGGLNIGLNENGGIKLGTKEGNVNLNTKNNSGNLSLGNGTDAINLNKAPKVEKVGCTAPMSDAGFESIKKQVASQASDTSKLIAANALIENNCFKTNQVKQLISLFSSDKSKIELAKNAYPYTNDLSNYHQLKDDFSEDESRKELTKFIHAQK